MIDGGQSCSRPKWRWLVAPGITAFITFWLLIALGVWQLQRYKLKEGIEAVIHEAALEAPVALPARPSPYEKVFISGRWVPGKAALYGDIVHDAPAGPIAGGELIMPFRRPNGQIVLVDLGWVPEQSPSPLAEPAGETRVVGYVHAPILPGWFAAPDDPGQELYYTLNPARMGAGLGFVTVAPYTLIAMGPLPPP